MRRGVETLRERARAWLRESGFGGTRSQHRGQDIVDHLDALRARLHRAGVRTAKLKVESSQSTKRYERMVAKAEKAAAEANKLRELQAVEWIVPLKALVDDYSTIIRDQRREIARLNQLLSGKVTE